MLDLLGKGTDRGYSMIGVGLSAGLSGSRRARTVQDPLPALDLDWATNRSLPASYGPTPSFSRASTGTYFDGMGVLKTAAVNGPRFDHVYNGTSWVSKGLLVEEQRTNLCKYSEDLTQVNWTKTQLSVSSNAIAAPDGNTTADKLVENTATAEHYLRQQFSGLTSGSVVSFSAYFKQSGRATVAFYGSDDVAKNYPVLFDLANGVVLGNLTSYGAYAAPLSSSITNVGNGWYRCTVVAQLDAGRTTASITVTLANTTSTSFNGSYTGDGTSGVYIWGAQVEVGSFPTSYIPTTSALATRSADVCQITGTNFSSFWNASEGAVAVEFDRLSPIGSSVTPGYVYPRTFQFAGTSGNSIDYFGRHDTSPAKELITGTSSSVQQFALEPTTTNNTSLGIQKIALGFASNDAALSYQGASVLTDNTVVVPVVTSLAIGSLAGSSNYLNGHIARLRYYPTRLTNAKLQELST